MQIFPIIVIYNANFKSCRTYRSLLSKHPELPFLIYENSAEPLNEKYADGRIMYFHDRLNSGVSAAYNYGSRVATERGGFDWLLLLDDDTTFEDGFFDKLTEAMRQNPNVDVFAPTILFGDDKPFSPVKFTFFKSTGVRLKPSEYSLNTYLPVNSGTCVRLNTFKKAGGYNERIMLDFSDFDFFRHLRQFNSRFVVVDSTARQRFSNDETDIAKLLVRFNRYLDGASCSSFKWYCSAQVLRHTVALTLRTQRLVFIRQFITKFLLRK